MGQGPGYPPSANSFVTVGVPSNMSRMTSGTPSRSWISAGVNMDCTRKVFSVTCHGPLAALDLLARIVTAGLAARRPLADRNPKGGSPYKRPYGEPEAKAQENFTDPESRIMKTSTEGFQQCCNAQAAVDADHQMIVATEVGQQANDQGQLNAMLDRVEATAGAAPVAVLADAGYCSEEALTALGKN